MIRLCAWRVDPLGLGRQRSGRRMPSHLGLGLSLGLGGRLTCRVGRWARLSCRFGRARWRRIRVRPGFRRGRRSRGMARLRLRGAYGRLILGLQARGCRAVHMRRTSETGGCRIRAARLSGDGRGWLSGPGTGCAASCGVGRAGGERRPRRRDADRAIRRRRDAALFPRGGPGAPLRAEGQPRLRGRLGPVGCERVRGEDHGREHDGGELLAVAVLLIGGVGVAGSGRPVLERLACFAFRNRAVARMVRVLRESVLGRETEGRGRNEGGQQGRRVDRELRPVGAFRNRQEFGVALSDLIDEVTEIAPPHGRVQDLGGDDVAAVDPGEVHDRVAVRPAEGEPGFPFVAQTPFAADLQAGPDQRGLDPIELREFLLRPAALARRCGPEERDYRTHRGLTSAVDIAPRPYRSWKPCPRASKNGATR